MVVDTAPAFEVLHGPQQAPEPVQWPAWIPKQDPQFVETPMWVVGSLSGFACRPAVHGGTVGGPF